MKLDDNAIRELASQFGVNGTKNVDMNKVKDFEKKDDREILAEIMNLRRKLEAANIPYEKQMAALTSLMPVLDSNQKARLQKIIELMER